MSFARIECSKCADVIEVEADAVSLPFVCFSCEEDAKQPPVYETETGKTNELVADLTEQLQEAKDDLAAMTTMCDEFMEHCQEFAVELVKQDAELEESQTWELLSHTGLGIAMKKIEELEAITKVDEMRIEMLHGTYSRYHQENERLKKELEETASRRDYYYHKYMDYIGYNCDLHSQIFKLQRSWYEKLGDWFHFWGD